MINKVINKLIKEMYFPKVWVCEHCGNSNYCIEHETTIFQCQECKSEMNVEDGDAVNAATKMTQLKQSLKGRTWLSREVNHVLLRNEYSLYFKSEKDVHMQPSCPQQEAL